MPRVSVVVNTVDRVDDLKRCLDSILNQTFRDFELVVVNNGTSLEARESLGEFENKYQRSDIRFKIIEDRTKKLSYLFNIGWQNSNPASGYLAYLADDTEADRLYLSKAVEYLDDHLEVAAVSGPVLSTSNPPGEMNYLYDLARKNPLTKLFLKVYEYFVMENRLFEPGHWCQSGAFTLGAGIPQPQIKEPVQVDLLTSTSLVIRREALEKVGGFDENFLFNHADGDLFIRLQKIGYKLIFHPLVKVSHHMRFGPTRSPGILARDTAFYYLKDVRPKSLRGGLGAILNLCVFIGYFVFKTVQTKSLNQLRGLSGFWRGVFDFFRSGLPQAKELRGKILVGFGFVFLFWFIHRRVGSWGMLAYGDATPFPENFKQAFEFFFQSYDPRSPGVFMPQAGVILSTLIPVEAFLAFLFGGNFVWAQRIFHFLPIPLSFITIYYFVSQFTSSRLARFITAVIYSGNHFMVAEFAGGFAGNLYVPAFFPILVLLLYRLSQRSLKGIPLPKPLLQYSALLTIAYVLSDHVLILLVPFWLIFIISPFFVLKSNRFRYVFKNFLVLLISNVLIFLLSAYHAYGYFKIAAPFLSRQTLPADLVPFFIQNLWDTYWRMTLGNTLRLGGSYFSNFYGGNDSWARLGFIIPFLALSWFLFKNNRRGLRLKIGLLFSLLAIVGVVFIYLTGRGTTHQIFKNLPFLFRFRNPSRLSLFLAFLYSTLTALTLEAWFLFLRGKWERKKRAVFLAGAVLSMILMIGLGIYLKGFWSGDLTLAKNRGRDFWISHRYYQLGQFISRERQKGGIFRTAYFPWTHEGTEVKLFWLDPYALGVPIEYGAYIRNQYLNFIKTVYKGIADENVADLGSLLAEGGVRYLVLDARSLETGRALYRYDYHVPWLLGSYDDIHRIVVGHSELKLKTVIDGFEVYENSRFDPTKIDLKKAGFWMENRQREDGLRQILIVLTGVSWLVLGIVYFKPGLFSGRSLPALKI